MSSWSEVSTFQLEFTTRAFAPDVAVLLNVAQDHIDWHGSVEAYAKAKAKVFGGQRPDQVVVVNVDDPVTRRLAQAAPSRVVTSSRTDRGATYHVVDNVIEGPDVRVACRTSVPPTTSTTRSPPLAAALGGRCDRCRCRVDAGGVDHVAAPSRAGRDARRGRLRRRLEGDERARDRERARRDGARRAARRRARSLPQPRGAARLRAAPARRGRDR